MGDKKTYGLEVRLFIEAEGPMDAVRKVTTMIASAIAAGYGIEPLFAVGLGPTAESEAPKADDQDGGESPKAEDVFGRIMSAPDVQ